jgi:hypothetical protein
LLSSIFSDEIVSFTDDKDVQSYFLEGQCPALAYEIHKLTGLTIAMLSDEPVGSPDYLAHVFIMDSNGLVIDIKGRRTLQDVRNEWYFCKYLHRFWNLKDFEYEMLDWDLTTRFDKDLKAKKWAKIIVDILN